MAKEIITPDTKAETPAKSFFNDAEVAQKYQSAFGVDKKITIPGLYSGPLSAITLEVAERLVKMGDNQLAEKAAKG